MKKELNRGVLIKSGYRSPAYQALVVIYNLSKNNYNIRETLRRVTLPGYSEHGYPAGQAVDFITENGVIWGDEICFNDTEEYGWMLKNAAEFGFELSYPENNPRGITFEPWHWHYSPEGE